ncbi:MAG TPA: hypothetical protein VGA99_08220 [bacterium]
MNGGLRFCAVAPTFVVSDISATMRWYETNLGFTGDPFPDEEPYVFAIMARDKIEIMLQCIEGYQKPDLSALRPAGVWDAYIRIEGVKEFYKLVRARIPIKSPLTKRSYGDWEFEVTDPNGYVLVFSELLE